LAQQEAVPEERIRQAIAALQDVGSCRVEMGADGGIAAVHIVSRTKRAAKQIVRDVESVLYANFGIRVDHRKVSVARLGAEVGAKVEKAARPRFVSMSISSRGGRGRCEVVLERDGLEVKGEATGTVTGPGRLRLVAKATFGAIEKLVDEDVTFDVLDVMSLRTAERGTVVVLASFVSQRDAKNLAGCVQFTDNEQQAAVLAALDACNRIVETFPQVEHTEYEVSPYEEH
jgi:hypothetical protein